MQCQYAATDTASRYVAGTLPQNETLAFEEHCFSCEACADEIENGAAIRLALHKPRRRKPWMPLAAAAAVLAIVVVLVPRERAETMRGSAPAIVMKAVANDRQVRVEWSAVKGAARYVVTLNGEDGTVLQQRETTATNAAFPMATAGPAFASVRALSAEGEEIARTKPQRVGS